MFEFGFTFFPVLTMPELAIDKDSYFICCQRDIGRTGELFIITSVSISFVPY